MKEIIFWVIVYLVVSMAIGSLIGKALREMTRGPDDDGE